MRAKSFMVLAGAVACCLVGLFATSCGGAKSGRGFRLPDGDVEKGRAAFVQLRCTRCHSVKGVELPKPAIPGPVQVELGGEVPRVKTYGQLVTSIIKPSHVESEQYLEKFKGLAPMQDFRDTMTVRQMIDVVAFLHSTYTKVYPAYMDYSFPYDFPGGPINMPRPPATP